jgi:hypothetical protein
MKVVFWIMLVANLVFFAVMQWGSHWFAPPALEQAEPELNPQKITLQKLVRPTIVSAVAASSVVSSEVAATSAVNSAVSQVPPAPHLACMEWAEFSAADLPQAQKSLEPLHLTPPPGQRTIQYRSQYWAYIPPPKNAAKLKQRLAELKSAGVSEYAVVQEAGAWQYAISLGTFDSQENAQAFASFLHKLPNIKVGEYRPARQTTALVFNGLDGATLAKLTELQKQFPTSTLNNLPCH